MAVIKGTARQTTSRQGVSEGADVYLNMLRDGSVGVADWIAMLSLAGRVFTVNGGTATTPITFGAGTLDVLEHDLFVSVPSSVVIIPLELTVNFDVYGTIQIVECLMQYGTGGVAGTGTAATPRSSNANTGLTSACTVTLACATGTNLTTVVSEFWHDGIQLGVTVVSATQIRQPTRFSYNALDTGVLHVIGPSQQLIAYASAQAGTGFLTFKYVELPVASV